MRDTGSGKPLKGVFFDVGGTLFTYRHLPQAIRTLLGVLAEKLELRHEPGELLSQFAQANKDADKAFAERPAYLFRDYFETVFLNWLDRLESRHLHKHVDWVEALHRKHMLDAIVPMEDLAETLDRIKAMGLYMGVVSNADENQLMPLIEAGNLKHWLDHWTSSEEAQSNKPDRRFFEVALGKSGLKADQVLFVGDSPEQDIAGAHAMGMRTVLITEGSSAAPMTLGKKTPEPDFRIRRLSELPVIVEKLLTA